MRDGTMWSFRQLPHLCVLIPPLEEGAHTIEIHGDLCDSFNGSELFEVDVTYILTVE